MEKSTTKIDTSINSLNNEFYRLIDCSYAEKKETVSKSGDGNVYRKKKNNAVLKTAYESSQVSNKTTHCFLSFTAHNTFSLFNFLCVSDTFSVE